MPYRLSHKACKEQFRLLYGVRGSQSTPSLEPPLPHLRRTQRPSLHTRPRLSLTLSSNRQPRRGRRWHHPSYPRPIVPCCRSQQARARPRPTMLRLRPSGPDTKKFSQAQFITRHCAGSGRGCRPARLGYRSQRVPRPRERPRGARPARPSASRRHTCDACRTG